VGDPRRIMVAVELVPAVLALLALVPAGTIGWTWRILAYRKCAFQVHQLILQDKQQVRLGPSNPGGQCAYAGGGGWWRNLGSRQPGTFLVGVWRWTWRPLPGEATGSKGNDGSK
jgi:hypothetical protein